MDKEQARARLAAIKAEAEELQRVIDTPEPAPSLIAEDGLIYYAESLNTLVQLRQQEGTVPPRSGKQALIVARGIGEKVTPVFYGDMEKKVECISPCFSSYEYAIRAIQNIGAERILRMFKQLHHID